MVILDSLRRPGYMRATSVAVFVFLSGAVISASILEGGLVLGVGLLSELMGLLSVLIGIYAGGRLNGFASRRQWAILSVMSVGADFVVVIALLFLVQAIVEA
jgi:Kef-type K+ transport system membrane component KefB